MRVFDGRQHAVIRVRVYPTLCAFALPARRRLQRAPRRLLGFLRRLALVRTRTAQDPRHRVVPLVAGILEEW